MLYKSPAAKKLIQDYLKLKKVYSDLLDHCHIGKTFDSVMVEMNNVSEKLRFIFPKGRTFAHGFLIINEGLDLGIIENHKKEKKACLKK